MPEGHENNFSHEPPPRFVVLTIPEKDAKTVADAIAYTRDLGSPAGLTELLWLQKKENAAKVRKQLSGRYLFVFPGTTDEEEGVVACVRYTRHGVDVQYRDLREFWSQGFFRIVLVRK